MSLLWVSAWFLVCWVWVLGLVVIDLGWKLRVLFVVLDLVVDLFVRCFGLLVVCWLDSFALVWFDWMVAIGCLW